VIGLEHSRHMWYEHVGPPREWYKGGQAVYSWPPIFVKSKKNKNFPSKC
jgi:hypothetical protein